MILAEIDLTATKILTSGIRYRSAAPVLEGVARDATALKTAPQPTNDGEKSSMIVS